MVQFRASLRFVLVAYQFLPLILAYARDRRRFLLFGGRRRVSSAVHRRRARSLLDSLLTLGPTFIKLGQLLSTRPDVLPPEYIEEFESLQDQVPPAAWADAKDIIEQDLGPVDEQFVSFDTEPISGASLGQVYVAEVPASDLPDEGPGRDRTRKVAVKVRRPGIEELVAADLQVIKFSLAILMYFVDDARSFSLETLADEFEKTINEEMDYRRERRMLEEIRDQFREREDVRMPRTLEGRSSGRVLTMEYVPGTKITDVESIDALGVDRTALATTLQRVYLKMIVEDGTFHADPHPGNLAVQQDGTIVFYDFGMSGHVDPFIQRKIVDFYIAVGRQDTDAILDTLIEMGTLSPNADREVMSNVMELAIADARGENIEQYRVQQIVSQVEDTIYEFPLRLPPNLALILRVATVVEGVCVTLDSDFDFISVATDYLREQGFLQESAREYARELGGQALEGAESVIRVPPKLENALDRMNRDALTVQVELADEEPVINRLARRLVLGMLLSTSLFAAAVLFAFADPVVAAVPAFASAFWGALLYRSFSKRRGIRARPQFTRQQMRRRREE